MEPANGIILILTTVSTSEQASEFALDLVKNRLAACVTRLPNALSTFIWKGDSPSDESEVLLLLKSHHDKLPDIEAFFASHHPYEVPELLVFDATGVAKSYQDWLIGELQ